MKILQGLGLLLLFVGVVLMVDIGCYSWEHPDMTQKRVFLENSGQFIAGILLIFAGYGAIRYTEDE